MKLRAALRARAFRKILRTIPWALEHLWNKTPAVEEVFRQLTGIKAIESSGFLERAMGIEPTSAAWEAAILPLNHARSGLPYQSHPDFGKPALNSRVSRYAETYKELA
jgi:hypothetical protein